MSHGKEVLIEERTRLESEKEQIAENLRKLHEKYIAVQRDLAQVYEALQTIKS